MVLTMIGMICFMVFDRYLYSTQSYANRRSAIEAEDEELDEEQVEEDHFKEGKEMDLAEQERIEREEEARNFHKWMIPQYLPKGFKRVLRFYWLWFSLIIVHWLIFFVLTDTKSVCNSRPYCNTFWDNGYLIFFYLIFCVYFALCAS